MDCNREVKKVVSCNMPRRNQTIRLMNLSFNPIQEKEVGNQRSAHNLASTDYDDSIMRRGPSVICHSVGPGGD